MFCQNCGRQLPDDAKFCGGCGASLAEEPQGSANAQPAPQFNQQVQAAQPQAQPKPSVPPSETVKKEVTRLQTKLDNSDVGFFKGRSVWDICGMISVALMVLCLFIPVAFYSSTFTGTRYISILSIVTSSYVSSSFAIFIAFLVPPLFGAYDVLMPKENSTRHVRLIALGVFSIILSTSVSGVAGIAGLFMSANLFVGFYLNIIAALIMIAVGVIGIFEEKKGKIAG